MKHVRDNKFRGFWSFFRSTYTSPLVSKVLQRPVRKRTGRENRAHSEGNGIPETPIRSIAKDFRSSESAVAKGAGTREGIKALQKDILSSCDQLLNRA